MKGSKRIVIFNRVARFDFTLYRNITIIRGDSGTGKTTLFNMVADYTRDGAQSGVNISAPCPCVALIDMNWEIQLRSIHESIVFVDEDINNRFLNTKAFAQAVRESDNYYVLITREDLHDLPYSIEEIYEIKASGKYHKFNKLYKSRFANGYYKTAKSAFDSVLTEDAKAGYQFFSAVFSDLGTQIASAGGNSVVYAKIMESREKIMLVIADGAAFGAEIDRVLKLERSGYRFFLYLPESFEWIILKSGLIKDVSRILDDPSTYIESERYQSWEQFFTALLTEKTQNSYLTYKKTSLNENYLHETEKKAILDVMPDFKK